MMVTFVSQCEKKSLARTRRVLDAFADRIGDNTWQTVITQEGLLAVKKLLRKTASKSTAVSCFWIRSRSRSELVWIVGNRQKFNEQGIVPVNSTLKDILNSDWESHWKNAYGIQILAVLGALLHDLGKATVGFQNKLVVKKGTPQADPYRHEWISLQIFLAMIHGCESDEEWLQRMVTLPEFITQYPDWLNTFGQQREVTNLHKLPPLAQLISWLIVTHHRLPFHSEDYSSAASRRALRRDVFLQENTVDDFYQYLKPVERWVKNSQVTDDQGHFWKLKAPIFDSRQWQKSLARWARKAIHDPALRSLGQGTIADPFVMHLARLCLMVGDHNFSSLNLDKSNQEVAGDKALKDVLLANTDMSTGAPKQALDQHLLGVAKYTAQFSRLLPQLSSHLPVIDKIKAKAFNRRTDKPIFQWQNRAFDLAKQLQESTEKTGFFGINMASTGCGKTVANARIMYGLANPKVGARFTIALGLRVLTLQTGMALRDRLNLDENSLAILVGSAASQKLFDLSQNNVSTHGDTGENDDTSLPAASGSESLAELIDEAVKFGSDGFDSAVLGTVIANNKARDLLFAPIVSCTVDHIVGATETLRGGKYIAPMLRLLSSDLILDEPDDFNQSDLPALSRLVHMAGMFGSRVLLSSATLTPDLTAGLFAAYAEGRKIWQEQTGLPKSKVACAWFDEYGQRANSCESGGDFLSAHDDFSQKRAKKLAQEKPRRSADILQICLPSAPEKKIIDYTSLAAQLLASARELHQSHHETQAITGKTASVGLIRLANIGPLIDLAKELYTGDHTMADVQVHLCCYHARQLLVLRNSLETALDRLLRRSETSSLFDHADIVQTVTNSPKQHHIFIVLATAVAEVGRDHDYDWAIVEPSSMRSIIQLAGRVWRHRPSRVATVPNINIMSSNIKALGLGANLGVGRAVFVHPGFEESPDFLLRTHETSALIREEERAIVTAIPRIVKPSSLQQHEKLADLEHGVMAALLNSDNVNVVNSFWREGNGNRSCVHLQRITPFREQIRPQDDYVCLPDISVDSGYRFAVASAAWRLGLDGADINHRLQFSPFQPAAEAIQPWLDLDLAAALKMLGRQLEEDDLLQVALRYATVRLDEHDGVWRFNPILGFWVDS